MFIFVSTQTPQMTTRCSGFWTTYGSASQNSLSKSDTTNTPECTPSSSRRHTRSERQLLSFLEIMNGFFRWCWCNYHVYHEMRRKGQEMLIVPFKREPLKKTLWHSRETKYTTVFLCGSMVEHCVCCAKGCGFDSQGTHVLMKMYNLNAIISRFG